ncbi:MAG: hypothetical protein A2289_00150 [Deltaproteobacteria bacterium RIFOXYA12_FULL_58_15]|nr:MAG: hypothetical protein A2289_00150 [Deltaproteobacteria bacterium RIFOXYA12_FULL_58_15]OGR08907.1 MAG: hypothetical protein A2341_27785 [Deltaproteobacteria bacterium RIFOXYB12_FULL_58_9]
MHALIALFDIDGTLLTMAGAGKAALDAAFLARLGIPDATRDVKLAGMTDPSIVRATLQARGVEDSDTVMRSILDTYLCLLPNIVANTRNAVAKPGAHALTQWLQHRADVALGLGTGNMERGARIKLDRVGLDGRFAFGGYGSDHEDRRQVIAAGIERGRDHLGTDKDGCEVLIIGDTPSDVAAARANDARCLAVASGPYSARDLSDAGADWVARDLADAYARAAFAELGIT